MRTLYKQELGGHPAAFLLYFGRMMLLEMIEEWQQEALGIRLPAGSDRVGAVGSLPGPDLFPEGRGIDEGCIREGLHTKSMLNANDASG